MSLHLMVDLETLGAAAAPNVVTLSIGACLFDPTSENSCEDLHAEGYHQYLDPQEQIQLGARVDWSTILWWQNQGAEARTTMFSEQLTRRPLRKVLQDLTDYCITGLGGAKVTHIWGNGPSFDCAILNNLYKLAGMPNLFPYYTQQCVRTIGLAAGIKKFSWGVAHDALDDAVSQAVYVQRCYKKLGLAKEV